MPAIRTAKTVIGARTDSVLMRLHPTISVQKIVAPSIGVSITSPGLPEAIVYCYWTVTIGISEFWGSVLRLNCVPKEGLKFTDTRLKTSQEGE
jgi:hypothetical protein